MREQDCIRQKKVDWEIRNSSGIIIKDSTSVLETKTFHGEVYESYKFTIKKLIAYVGLGVDFQYSFYYQTFVPPVIIQQSERFDKDISDYKLNVSLPLFLEYYITPKFSLFTNWKPYLYHGKKLNLENPTSTKITKATNVYFRYASIGFHFKTNKRFQFILVPNFNQNLAFSGIDCKVKF
jgi:hypothetical protein